MKIINNDSVLVQNRDLAYLTHYNGDMPASIFIKICGEDVAFIDSSNINEFVKFDSEEEIDFFKYSDWILDYNLYNFKSVEELYAVAEKMIDEINHLTSIYNRMSGEEQEKSSIMIEQMNLMIFEVQSIRELIKIKQGNNNVVLSKLIPINDKITKMRARQQDEKIGGLILEEIAESFKKIMPKRLKKKLEIKQLSAEANPKEE